MNSLFRPCDQCGTRDRKSFQVKEVEGKVLSRVACVCGATGPFATQYNLVHNEDVGAIVLWNEAQRKNRDWLRCTRAEFCQQFDKIPVEQITDAQWEEIMAQRSDFIDRMMATVERTHPE